MSVVDYDTYVSLQKQASCKGLENVRAFYNHELKVFCKDPRALLIPLDDHLVHRGDGVFESLTCAKRKILHLDKHLSRLQNSLQAIKLISPVDYDELRELIIKIASIGDFEQGSIRLLIGRGRGGFGVDPRECEQASLYIVASESKVRPESFWEQGMKACRSNVPVKQKYLAKIKSTNYLPNVLMAQEAHAENVNMVFSFDEEGYLAESAICNVAMYKDNTFYFPQFEKILSGTAALLAFELAKELGNVCTCNITEEMLERAEEIFALGSTLTCMGIVEYNHKKVGNGLVGVKAKALRLLLSKRLEDEGVEY